MPRKKGWNKKQEKTWLTNHRNILEAIRKIEKRLEKATFSKISRQLRDDNNRLNDRILSKHLKSAKKRGKLVQEGRVYSSKIKILADMLYKSVIVSESLSNVPLLDNQALEDFVNKQTPTLNKAIDDYEKKAKNPIYGRLYKKLVQDPKSEKLEILPYIRERIMEDSNYIRKATEIKVLSSKKLQYLNIKKLGKTFTEILFRVLRHERDLAISKGQEFSMNEFGLIINLSFNPKKAGDPPSPETVFDWIKTQERLDPHGMIFDKEFLEQIKQTRLDYQDLILQSNETDKKFNPLGWDIPCPYHFGYLAEKPIGTETPKDCFNCPKYEECSKKQK